MVQDVTTAYLPVRDCIYPSRVRPSTLSDIQCTIDYRIYGARYLSTIEFQSVDFAL